MLQWQQQLDEQDRNIRSCKQSCHHLHDRHVHDKTIVGLLLPHLQSWNEILNKKMSVKMGFRGNTRIGQLSRPHRCWWQNDRQLLVDEDFDRFCQHYWRRAPIFKRCHQYWNSVTNIYVTKWIISGIFMTTEFEIKKIALENPSQKPAMWGTRC